MLISLKKLGHPCISSFPPIKPLVNFTKQVSWRYFMLRRFLYFLPELAYCLSLSHDVCVTVLNERICWAELCLHNLTQ